MFGYVLYESLLQYPKVLTATEISKRLKIGYKAASLLKRRFQLFSSQQLPKYKNLTYEALKNEFQDFLLPPNENTDISNKMANRPYTCVDTAVLYSAGERANQGRKRYSHRGQTSSIYLSEKLGGRQVGTLVQTIAIKQGPVFFTSVRNQKAETLGPIIKDHLPTSTPLFTDQGYPWLWGIYRNHRSVNHSARSKDNRYRWARNRWSKNGVHSQVAEGNHRVLKTAFASYGWIHPKYSALYLNEFSFIKNAGVFGLDVLLESGESDNSYRNSHPFPPESRGESGKAVRIGGKGFSPKNSKIETENWLQNTLQGFLFKPEILGQDSKVLNHTGYGLFNSPLKIEKAKKYERRELEKYNSFWIDKKTKKFQRDREIEYQKIASKIWNLIHSEKERGEKYSVTQICDELRIHKHTAMTILRKWLKLKIIAKRRIGYNAYDHRINFYIKIVKDQLPCILYSNFRPKASARVTKNEK
ncbi:ISXO2-like transposase domain protein [Leptospira broomii serovar Hurstbridge str. 5399]|uniref:ISXO2-like transposase domain protein n=1 Tax=Leptospira broomii serovar Hurstbridge str. 5399 TaxID=1049789 RepID=T0F8S2_9LEPT|nr:ISXO2-like transposase domain protein [Leptospira broomii serovar Hurstbridge str. 5399]